MNGNEYLRISIRQRARPRALARHLLPLLADLRPGAAAVAHVDELLVVREAVVVAAGDGAGFRCLLL